MSVKKRGQVAIFIIIAIVLAAGVVLFFIFRGSLGSFEDIPSELAPVFSFYLSCIEQEARAAVDLAGTQGGYTDMPEYAPGSEYAPFSSQLNFFGFPVPYWYYVSGNGLIKEQVPSKSDIEAGIENYISNRLANCDFNNFYLQGFDITLDEPEVRTRILDNKIDIEVDSNLAVYLADSNARKSLHKVSLNTQLGKFYNEALKIYEKEIEEAFLEEYAVDVLRLYAPVDGVELTCSSKIWKTEEVVGELQSGLEANIGSLRIGTGYYSLNDKKEEYFIIEHDNDVSVNLLYSKNWPSRLEIYGEGVENELLVAEPVGIQEGLGILGFCYAPYHFVYDLSFPVLIQIYNNDEIFQFPVVVVIDKNVPRNGLESQIEETETFDLCAFYSQDVEINVFDVNLNNVNNARLDYICFNQRCSLGETENGKFIGKAPACVNGFVNARAEGFTEKRQLFSTNEQKVADVILDREHEIEVSLKIGGVDSGNKTAIITFEKVEGDRTVSAALPEFSTVKLSEGEYEVRVFAYTDSDIKIPGSTKKQCVEVPKEGVLGFFGGRREECYNIETPETNIDYALIGGGKSRLYILEDQLQTGKAVVEVDRLLIPKTLEDLQLNFASFDTNNVEVNFI